MNSRQITNQHIIKNVVFWDVALCSTSFMPRPLSAPILDVRLDVP
jgi:hypothetical protein